MDVLADIQRRVLGDEIADLRCGGFLEPGDPHSIAQALSVSRGGLLLDAGCGNARLGVETANRIGVRRYVGFDRDEKIVTVAREVARAFPEASVFAASFESADFDLKADAALALDSIYLADEPSIALRNLGSLLRGGATLYFTVYVGEGVQEGGVRGRTESGWLAALTTAGFEVVDCNDATDQWRHWARQLHSARLEAWDQVVGQLGPVAGLQRLRTSRRMLGRDGRPAFLDIVRRAKIVATKSRRPNDR